MKKIILIFLALLLMFSCKNYFDFLDDDLTFTTIDIPPAPKGYGTFTPLLAGNDFARNVLPPQLSLSQIAVFEFEFTGTATVGGDRTYAQLVNPNTAYFVLPTGTYNLAVTAFTDAGKDFPVLHQIITGINITEGSNVNRTVNLLPFTNGGGDGTFAWYVDWPTAVVLSEATMTLTNIDNTAAAPYSVNLINSPMNSDMIPSGYYQLVVTLVRSDGQKHVYRNLVHVYLNMTSFFERDFLASDFDIPSFGVTFHANGGTPDSTTPVTFRHGEKIGTRTVTRTGYDLDGWYTDAAFTAGNEWDLVNYPVMGNMQLYAKWVSLTCVPCGDILCVVEGNGSTGSPFTVPNETVLRTVGRDAVHTAGTFSLDACYLQTANIPLNQGNWTRIGGQTETDGFTGTYNGGGHTIRDMTIAMNWYNGMFGFISTGGVVKNLGLIDVNIYQTTSYLGGIAGQNNGRIENCYVTGSLSASAGGSPCIGGLAGYQDNAGGGEIINCVSLVTSMGINGTIVSYAGRVTGSASDSNFGSITNSYTRADLARIGTVTVTTPAPANNNKHGADISEAQVQDVTWWRGQAGFNTTDWPHDANLPTWITFKQADVEVSGGVSGKYYGANGFDAAMTAIVANGAGTYTVTLFADQNFAPTATRTIANGVHITLLGDISDGVPVGVTERNITRTANFGFTIANGGSLTLGSNINLRGNATSRTAVLLTVNGTLNMLTGSKISEHVYSAGNGLIYLAGANSKFDMSGGSITNNTSSTNGLLIFMSNAGAQFTMSSGTISGNSSASESIVASSGVHVSNGTFTMSGGSITGNTTSFAAAPNSDVFITATTVANMATTKFILQSGASVGTVKLAAYSATVFNTITIDTGWSGTIAGLDLRGDDATIAPNVIDLWLGKTVLLDAAAGSISMANIGKFNTALEQGFWLNNTIPGQAQAIGSDYYFGTSGADMGKLMKKSGTTGMFNISIAEIKDVTITQLLDETISISGLNGPTSITITIPVPNNFTSYKWLLGSLVIGTTNSITIDTAVYDDIGIYSLSLQVEEGGIPYSKNVKITVVN